MNFLKKIFGKKDKPIRSYEEFWDWFKKHEKTFFTVVKDNGDIEKDFFDRLSSKLNELKGGFFFLTGMFDDKTVELVITADGVIKNIIFVEQFVDSAPQIAGWVFTKLKSPSNINNVNIQMAGYVFNKENISFYSNDNPDFPDEIDITIVHDDMNEHNKENVTNGSYIFLDNFLGELNFVTTIDTINVISKDNAVKELVPIWKLKDFLIWREKEFIEKYEGLRHNTENDNYSILEAALESGNTLVAVINTDLLEWDGKASHPWIVDLEIKYPGEKNNGMPDDKTCKWLDEVENDILKELKDFDGYLHIGRQTADGKREIYFACKDFRKPSKVLHLIEEKYANRLRLRFDIYKDKYWQSFDRFRSNE